MGIARSNTIMILLAASLAAAEGVHAAQADTIATYRQHIQTLESNHGVYAAPLGELLLGLGLAYQTDNDHQQAAVALKRALQIRRINNGLYDLNQLPVLEQLIKSNIASENWPDVDGNYHQMLWVHRRNYAGADSPLLPILNRVGRWKLRAYKHELVNNQRPQLLREADRLYSDAIAVVSSYNPSDSRLIEALYGQAAANYPIALDKVGRALQRVTSLYETNLALPRSEYANALAHLGDWNLLQGRRTRAHELYRDACRLIADDTAGQAQLDQLFGTPTVIPNLEMPLPELDQHQAHKADQNYTLVAFDVSKQGAPGNIRILAVHPPARGKTGRTTKTAIRSQRYRPRYENGAPVYTVAHQLRIAQEY